jgi:hypothetical protein
MTDDGSPCSRITSCFERIETSGAIWHQTCPPRSKMPKTMDSFANTATANTFDATRPEVTFVSFDHAREGRLGRAPRCHSLAQKAEKTVDSVADVPGNLGNLRGRQIGRDKQDKGPKLRLRKFRTS